MSNKDLEIMADTRLQAHLFALRAACRELVEFRRRVSATNIQIEKLDDFIRKIAALIEE